jgi:hypothetical protein
VYIALQESNQRFASEIIAAIISSSKHWNYEMVSWMVSGVVEEEG